MLNKFSIKYKILLGILIVLAAFFALNLFNLYSIDSIKNSYNKMISYAQKMNHILQIEKSITEIQREALVYGETGKYTIIDKMISNNDEIKERLKLIRVSDIDDQDSKILNYMDKIIDEYGVNISQLVKLHDVRSKLVKEELPIVFNRGSNLLKEEIKKIELLKNKDKVLLYQEALQLWLESYLKANGFLRERKFSYRQEVLEFLSEMEEKNNQLLVFHKNTQEQYEQLGSEIESFRLVFTQAIQANRNYLSLVNVVMAGEAHEFSILAKKFSTKSEVELKSLRNESANIIDKNLLIVVITLVGSIPFLFFILIYYKKNITDALTSITLRFKALVEGDMEGDIPGLNRYDEVGDLARAADKFKEMGENLNFAKLEAERAMRIKSEFLANMSHEIRTPMNGILGMVSILSETKLTEEQQGMLNIITSSGDGLLTILNDILDLSKVESGIFSLEREPFSLKECIEHICFLFSKPAMEKNIEFKTVVNWDNLPDYLMGDITRLKQILINLCSNAIKFTNNGSVTFFVEAAESIDEKVIVKFSIVDTGIGIDEDIQDSLFNAFTQADTSITRRFGGTGLGLAISSKLAEAMESKILVDSKKGQGSTFSVEFQFDTALDILKEDKDEIVEIQKSLRILIAEDNRVNFLVASKMLTRLGHQFDHALNGLEACELAKKNEYDLILMDMQMPLMDGIQATVKIREFNENIPIIALTANVMQEDQERCLKSGMNDFISKPIKFKDLKEFLYYLDEASS